MRFAWVRRAQVSVPQVAVLQDLCSAARRTAQVCGVPPTCGAHSFVSAWVWVILLGASLAIAQDKPAALEWTATDTAGKAVKVPAADRPTVLLFARAEQQQSKDAIAHVRAAIEKTPAAVVIIVSGEAAAEQAKTLADAKLAWPIVIDPKFEASGKMNVHVWPTTLIVSKAGEQSAHLAGMPPTFPADLSSYLDFSAGKIDKAALQQRLTTREAVADGDEQKAARHLQVARRLLDTADVRGARAEVEAALKLQPTSADLQLMLAKVQVMQNQPADALATLAKLPEKGVPAWQPALIKTWALIGQEKWADAKAASVEALKLNPQPAEAYYAAGLIAEQEKDSSAAAEYFKKAFESAADGRKLLAARSTGARK